MVFGSVAVGGQKRLKVILDAASSGLTELSSRRSSQVDPPDMEAPVAAPPHVLIMGMERDVTIALPKAVDDAFWEYC